MNGLLRWEGHTGRAYELRLGRLGLRVRTGAGNRWHFRGRSACGLPGFGGIAPIGPGLIWSVSLYPGHRRQDALAARGGR